MGWSTDWLYGLLLDHARETFAEAIVAAADRSEPRPSTLVATEHTDWNREATIPIGDPVRIWSSDDDFSTLLRSMPDIRAQNAESESIFSMAAFSFFINTDRAQLLICRWIGPRYADGGWWNIVGQGKSGKLIRAERRSWIS